MTMAEEAAAFSGPGKSQQARWNDSCITHFRKTFVYLPHEITEESRDEINEGSPDGID